eukprot:gene34378-57135_t
MRLSGAVAGLLAGAICLAPLTAAEGRTRESPTPPVQRTSSGQPNLEGIWAYGAETWSVNQADRYLDELTHAFERIAQSPTLFRERLEFSPP